MYSLHDIEVNGLDLAEVLECEIESRAGEHSTLVILARVTEEEFVFEISDCQDLEVLLREGEAGSPVLRHPDGYSDNGKRSGEDCTNRRKEPQLAYGSGETFPFFPER